MKIPSKKILPGDIVLCALTLVFAISLFAFGVLRPSASFVKINSDGNVREYSLWEEREILLESAGYSITVNIGGGEAWVSHSNCPDGVCVNTGKISKAGESIICAPARVVISVSGESEVDHALR